MNTPCGVANDRPLRELHDRLGDRGRRQADQVPHARRQRQWIVPTEIRA